MSQRTTRDGILDAVRDCVLEVGVRRATFAEVARRANVSRMTLYRHFRDVDSGLAALMTREFSALLLGAERDSADLPTARQRLVETAVLTVVRLREHELFRRVLDLDPELLLPYVLDRLGTTQRAAIDMIRRLLDAGQADGSIRSLDPDLAAYCVQLVGQSFVLAARVTEREHKPELVAAELRWLLDSYLRP